MSTTEATASDSLDSFFRGAFSIDIVLITYHEKRLKILIQDKKGIPFDDELGLPGKLILPNEDADKALDKFMTSLIGHCDFYKKQLRTFSEIGRHPLGRIITFAYYGLIPYEKLSQEISKEVRWCDIDSLPELSLDHNHIVREVLKRFKKGLVRHPIVFNTLSSKFILPEIIAVYEQTFKQDLDAPNFRKKILSSGLVRPLGEFRKTTKGIGRPAELYTMNSLENKKSLKDRIHFNFFD